MNLNPGYYKEKERLAKEERKSQLDALRPPGASRSPRMRSDSPRMRSDCQASFTKAKRTLISCRMKPSAPVHDADLGTFAAIGVGTHAQSLQHSVCW